MDKNTKHNLKQHSIRDMMKTEKKTLGSTDIFEPKKVGNHGFIGSFY